MYLGVKRSLSTLREDCRFRVVKNWVLRKTYGSRREEMTKTGANCILKSYFIGIPHKILFEHQIEENEISELYGTYETEQKCICSFGMQT